RGSHGHRGESRERRGGETYLHEHSHVPCTLVIGPSCAPAPSASEPNQTLRAKGRGIMSRRYAAYNGRRAARGYHVHVPKQTIGNYATVCCFLALLRTGNIATRGRSPGRSGRWCRWCTSGRPSME